MSSLPPPSPQNWFDGYEMSEREFNFAMSHLYRGELNRSSTWRVRLDATTNWAVVTTAALLTFAFGSAENHHVALLLGIMLTAIFLIIEARRYRYYELWALRVRLMETDFFGAMLNPPFTPRKDWARQLSQSLLNPQFPISESEAIGRRLRRHYFGLFVLLLISWFIKLLIHPVPINSYQLFIQRAAIGPLSGHIVLIAITVLYIFILFITIATIGLQNSPGEVLPRYQVFNVSAKLWTKLWSTKSAKHLVIIITDYGETVAQAILDNLGRGVTAIPGIGMYAHQERTVLLSGITATDIATLKAAVYNIDPNAFIVVNATNDIIGGGFNTALQPKWKSIFQKRSSNNE